MSEFSGYHAAYDYMKLKIKFNSIFLAFENELLVKFGLLYATTKVNFCFVERNYAIIDCIHCVS